MGLFQEYVKANLTPDQLESARKAQLKTIGELRGTEAVTFAAKIGQTPVPVDTGIIYEDVLPFFDVLEGATGKRVSVILETPGGFGEVGRSIVERLHERFDWVEFIVPGTAMSTGTIMCLGGDEILMGPNSSLGPIDAQLFQDGKRFSADAFLEGFAAIKREVDANAGRLNPAYIPILQRISPGELQNAHNALEFARATVTEWLPRYKFRNWEKDGVPVSDERKRERAREIAENLSKQSNWHTHGRSLRIPDLKGLGLKITDFSSDGKLYEAIQRYFVLLRLTLDSGPVYKIYETVAATVAKRLQVQLNPPNVAQLAQLPQQIATAQINFACGQCGLEQHFQLDFEKNQPLQAGVSRFPNTSELACPRCGNKIDLGQMRAAAEQQFGKKALDPQPT